MLSPISKPERGVEKPAIWKKYHPNENWNCWEECWVCKLKGMNGSSMKDVKFYLKNCAGKI